MRATSPIFVIARLMGVATSLLVAAPFTPGLAKCPEPPPAIRDFYAVRFYGDADGSVIDPELARRHKAAVAPLTAFLRQVTSDADKALRRNDPKMAACPLDWIASWAKDRALLGTMGTKQAEYQRKWDFTGLAMAYLKLSRHASPGQRATIQPWLIELADAATAFQTGKGRKRNNHLYWLGLGLAATGIAADSSRHWAAAREIMREAQQNIGKDGALPLELERGSRALHYHAFAVTPLVVMAELAARRGENWYDTEGGALHRLVAFTVRGLEDPAIVDARAGTVQERPPGTGAGWLTLYSARFSRLSDDRLPEVTPRHRWLGGDVEQLPETLVRTVKRPGR
jgi:poly(beta-D-mannuronate) lyase